jgi:replicative DNA helicase
MQNKLPPNNPEIEESIISGMILNEGIRFEVLSLINKNDFYKTNLATVFDAISKMVKSKSTIDLITICDFLKNSNELAKIGGAAYLAKITDCPIPSNTSQYCSKIKRYSNVRRLISFCNDTINKCMDCRIDDADFIIEDFKTSATSSASFNTNNPLYEKYLSNIYDAPLMVSAYQQYCNSLKNINLTTGIKQIDQRIRGIGGGEVLTIIARAGSFKTALLQNILKRFIKTSDKASLFCSLEMPIPNTTERFMQMIGGTSGRWIEAQFGSEDRTQADIIASTFIQEMASLFVIPNKIKLLDIPTYIDIIKKEYGVDIGAVGIDYLGLVDEQGSGEYDINSKIARGTKDIAKQINLPTVLLSQVSRKGGEGVTEVTLDAGRGSGAIEEAADFVLGLWQEPVEMINAQPEGEDEEQRFDLICKILKNRKGPKGSTWILDLNVDFFTIGEDARRFVKQQRMGGI